MPGVLGKRKAAVSEVDAAALAHAQKVYREHFEARFKPLPHMIAAKQAETTRPEDKAEKGDTDDSVYESEWGGMSDSGDEGDAVQVEVVDHSAREATTTMVSTSRKQLKAYLSFRPPSYATATAVAGPGAQAKPTSAQDDDSAALLAKDVALQRLLAESHLLCAAGGNASHALGAGASAKAEAVFGAGRTRRKTTDVRIMALGAKQSVLAQKSMPMAMRKGIRRAAAEKEAQRRRDARESGIVLERETCRASASASANARGAMARRKRSAPANPAVDRPGVGKMHGAELRLSKRDIRNIEGPGERGVGGKKRRRR